MIEDSTVSKGDLRRAIYQHRSRMIGRVLPIQRLRYSITSATDPILLSRSTTASPSHRPTGWRSEVLGRSVPSGDFKRTSLSTGSCA